MSGLICKQGLEIQVYSSAAGYYIGTFDEDGPRCRISEGYYKTRAKAEEALRTGLFCFRAAPENLYCNGGYGCVE